MTKQCVDCKDTFPKTDSFFYKNHKAYLSRCKECHKAYTAAKLWESRERDKIRRELEKKM